MLKIKKLKASIDPSVNSGRAGKEILKGVDLAVGHGEIHVLMGPNGSGKSTLAQVIAGHPGYTIDKGQLTFDKKDIKKLTADKRAKLGIFLAFQHPVEIPGVSVFNFLRRATDSLGNPLTRRQTALRATTRVLPKSRDGVTGHSKTTLAPLTSFKEELLEYASSLKLSEDFLSRSLNEGFSGGEKKRNEVLQLLALSPKLAILDEIDSGLDVDGLRTVAQAIKQFTVHSSQSSVILITHYARILKYLKPDFVHVMVDGKIVQSGKGDLAGKIEKKGYEKWQPAQ